MMVVHRQSGRVEHAAICRLPDYLDPGDLLVLNDTRVFPARTFSWRRDTRGKVEALFIEEVEPGC
jgi:S-adenosylmethionine:tRNA ribosyltransferase-isomerase